MRGKAALRDYWTTAVKAVPDLHFDIIGVYRGESTLVINYRNHRGTLVNEVLTFDGDGLVRGATARIWCVARATRRAGVTQVVMSACTTSSPDCR